MKRDDLVCYCFHIRYRKLVNFCRREHPRVASQLSECGGAGTGCGWCIPFLKRLFEQETSHQSKLALELIDPKEYAANRQAYIRAGHGTPPPGAVQNPDD